MIKQEMVLSKKKYLSGAKENDCLSCAKSKICVKGFPKASGNRTNEVLCIVTSVVQYKRRLLEVHAILSPS